MRPGQLLFAGFEGTEVPGDLARLVREGRVGGVVLFARNLGDPAQVRDLVARLHGLAPSDDYLIDILVDLSFVTPDKVTEVRTEAQAAGVGVVDLMVANKVIRPADVTQAKAAHFGAEVVNLADVRISTTLSPRFRATSPASTVSCRFSSTRTH